MKRRFTGKTRIFLAISGAIIVIALILQVFGAGINFGIDFTGGSLLTYSVGESYDVDDVYAILAEAGYTNYQVTKTEPTEASLKRREEAAAESTVGTDETAATDEAAEAEETAVVEETAMAAETAAADASAAVAETQAADETAAAEETATAEATVEATVEPTATPFVGMLDLDKSGIAQDKLTDLQIRLALVDETSGLEGNLKDAVSELFPDAKTLDYGSVTSRMINENDYDAVYSGGYIAEFEIGTEFDSDAVADQVSTYLEGQGYSVLAVDAIRYDAAAEAAAAEATATPVATDEVTGAEATVEPAAEATDAVDETVEATVVEESGTSLRLLVSIETQTTKVRDMIETEMKAKYPDFIYVQIDHVSATAGRDLIANAMKALLIAFACMLVYIAIRFDFYSGVVALGALVHDVAIMYAFMVFFGSLFQANSPFIAAILTIVGYSINNTIIIFDRVREVAKKPGFTQAPKMDVVETAVGATLSRTINTSITTMIALVFMYAFGVDAIREFMFPLIIGMLAGVYSSVFLATQVWAMWMDKRTSKKLAKDDKNPSKA